MSDRGDVREAADRPPALPDRLQGGVRVARSLLAADAAAVVLREGDQLRVAAVDGFGPEWLDRRLPRAAFPSIAQGRPEFVDDLSAHPWGRSSDPPLRCLLVVPIGSEDPAGALAVGWVRRDPPGDSETRLLQAHADGLSAVLENARLQKALRDYRDLTENVRQVLYVAAYDHSRTFYVSPRFEEIFGLPVEAAYADPMIWLKPVHPDDRERVAAVVRKGMGTGLYSAEYRLIRPDGSIRWVWDQAWEIAGPDGRPQRVVGITEDVTERKLREQQLADATARLRVMAQHLPGVFWAVDRELMLTFLAGQGVESVGLRPEEAVGKSLYEHLGTRDPDNVTIRACREALAGRPSVYEKAWGGRQFRSFVEPMRGADGRITGAIGFAVDETERREAQRTLEAWKERYETAIRVSGQILYDVDPAAGRVVFGGDTVRMLGYEPQELSGTVASWIPRLHPDDQQAFLALTGKASRERTPFHMDYRVRHQDGRWVTVHDDGFPLADEGGRVHRHVGLIRDVTAAQRLEEQLFQAQKMESIGRLAGGIAHDFNNLLTTILGYTEMVLQKAEPGSAMRAEIGEIKEAGLRAAGLTRQLLAFSRKQVLRPRVVDLHEVVKGIAMILRRTIGEHIALEVELDGGPAQVRADPSQLEQVLMNLAVNARDAMPSGGRLRIATARRRVDAGSPEEFSGAAPGEYLELTVEDSGTGMDPETRAHLFEPFFTTKEQGHGTGLGLSTVYGIVKQSGGVIAVDSAPGRGTRFAILLPAHAEPEDEARTFPPPAAAGGAEVVLLVEDEDAVRELAGEILRREGYVVLKARHGQDALEIAGRHAGRIDLVLTDVVMPVLGGPEMARRLRENRPGIRVMFMSGYTRDALLTRGGPLGPKALLLEKPFTPESLARTVRLALESSK